MKRAFTVLILVAGLSGCGSANNFMSELWHNIFSSEDKDRCIMAYGSMKDESNKAIHSTGLEKIAHLQAVQINTQLLIRDRCCRWSRYCLISVWSE
jgi:hypothetical protein